MFDETSDVRRYTPEEFEEFYESSMVAYAKLKKTTILEKSSEQVVIKFEYEYDGKCISFERVLNKGIRYDNGIIDIEHSYVDENDFKKLAELIPNESTSRIDGDFSFFDCEINLTGLQLPGCSFKASIFKKDANFSGSEFIDDVYFSGSEFIDDVYFRLSKFCGFADFSSSNFSEGANFSDSEFSEYAYFSDSNFSERADFSDSNFSEGANFSLSDFSEVADFSGSDFSGDADFSWTNFSECAYFSCINFSEGANFCLSEFSKYAYFFHSGFYGCADFSRTNFSEDANFSESEFFKDANFSESKFSGRVDFRLSEFSVDANFSESEFFKDANFSESKFKNLDIHNISLDRGCKIDWPTLNAKQRKRDMILKGERIDCNLKDPDPSIFLILKENYHKLGQYDWEDEAYVEYKREKKLEKGGVFKKLPALTDVMGEYGTNPKLVACWMLLVPLIFGVIYTLIIEFGSGISVGADTSQIAIWIGSNEIGLGGFYLSGITFLTIGFSGMYPVEALPALLVIIEGFLGFFLMAYFTISFTRKTLR